jgi:CubicO group peptidase (beta-lactamase class C family)
LALAAAAGQTGGRCQVSAPFGFAEPEAQGVNPDVLVRLTKWVGESRAPLLSLLISRNGRIVYELYTSSIRRDEAHYLMSVTKSVTSALIGVAIGQGLLKGADQTVTGILPREAFPDDASRQRFQSVTLKEVLGMSALDAPVAPHQHDEAAVRRNRDYVNAPNRVTFALSQMLLPKPGTDYLYTDVTPALAAGAIEYSSHMTLLDFANRTLFGPMHFAHQDWMHEDQAGVDNGAYGLRLRPVDMQKFGLLYLNRGCWEGKQLLSRDWVDLSFTPWIRSRPQFEEPNYGWYWWQQKWSGGWTAHIANGWKGQRIAVFPEQKIVVTMTAIIEDGGEEERVVNDVIGQFVIHLLEGSPSRGAKAELKSAMREVSTSQRIPAGAENRMLPSVAVKEPHHPFLP